MRKNEAYWAGRAARRVDLMEEDLLRYENELAAIYRQANVRIQADVRELLKRFSNRYGLSEQEALAMLDKPISPQEIAMLKTRLPLVQDEALKKAMQAKLEAQAYGYRMSRKEALGMDLQMHAQDIASRSNTVVSKALVNVAQSNDKRLLSDLGQQFKSKGINLSPNFSQFSQGYIESLTKQRWYGKDFSERIWGNTEKLAEKMNTSIMADLVAGKSNAKVAKTLQEEMGSGYKEAIRLVRTESNRVCNSADIERYKSLGIKYYKIFATKDARTSARCRKEDGNYYLVEEAETGKTLPPFHPNCRSTTHSVVKKKEIIEAMKARGELEIAQEGLPEGKKGLPEPPRGLPEPPRGLPGGNYPENPEGWKSYPMDLVFESRESENPKVLGFNFINLEKQKTINLDLMADSQEDIHPKRQEKKYKYKKILPIKVYQRVWNKEEIPIYLNHLINESIKEKHGELLNSMVYVLKKTVDDHIHKDCLDFFKENFSEIIRNPDFIVLNKKREASVIFYKSGLLAGKDRFISVPIWLCPNQLEFKSNRIPTAHIEGKNGVRNLINKNGLIYGNLSLLDKQKK